VIVSVYNLLTADINEAEKDSDGFMMINAATKAYLSALSINNRNILDPASAIKIYFSIFVELSISERLYINVINWTQF
jgi:hypothetical protein